MNISALGISISPNNGFAALPSNSNLPIQVVEIKYDIEDIIIESEDLKHYECNICCGYISNDINKIEIYQCLNSHILCIQCWNKEMEIRKCCPQCRKPVNSMNNLVRNRFMEDTFKDKLVKCPYSLESITRAALGLPSLNNNNNINNNFLCNQKVKIESLSQHLKECQYQIIKCNCGSKFNKSQLIKHQDQECSLALTLCYYCKTEVIKNCLDLHYEVCQKFIIECTNKCGANIERSKLLDHKTQDCLKEIIQCSFRLCDQALTKQEMILHFSDHIQVLSCDFNNNNELLEKIQNLEDEVESLRNRCSYLESRMNTVESLESHNYENFASVSSSHSEIVLLTEKINSLELKLAQVQNKPTTTTTTTSTNSISQDDYSKLLKRINKLESNKEKLIDGHKIEWVILNYPQVPKYFGHKDQIKSPKFTVDGLNFHILLFPLGYNGNPNSISLFLLLVSGKADKILFTTTLENSLPSRKVKKDLTMDFSSKDMNGYYNFIEIGEITKDNGYISGDKLRFSFKIKFLGKAPKSTVPTKTIVIISNIVKKN